MSRVTIIIFRVDSSYTIATGHIMRCIVLAQELQSKGFDCHFVMRPFDGNIISKVQEHGFKIHVIEQSIRGPQSESILDQEYDFRCTFKYLKKLRARGRVAVVVDHYSLSGKWETLAKEKGFSVFVIDDLADRTHDCHLLFDSGYNRCGKHYEKLVGQDTEIFVGTKYAVMKNEFSFYREKKRQNLTNRDCNWPITKVLISMGEVILTT